MRGYSFFTIAFIVVISLSFVAQERHRVLERERLALTHSVREAQESLRILEAEWSMLSAPWRIATLNKRYLFLRHGPQTWDEESLFPTDSAFVVNKRHHLTSHHCVEGGDACE